MLKLDPMPGYVVIKRKVQDDISKGGIVILETAKAKTQQGTVVAACPPLTPDTVGASEYPELKPGDDVCFGAFAGTDMQVDEDSYLVVMWQEVMCVVRPNGKAKKS